MSTEIYKRVLYNDGEGLTHGDANDAQEYLRAVVWDKIVQNLIGNTKLTDTFMPEFGGQNGVDAPNHLAYCLHGGQAYLRPGTTANAIQIAPGVLMQKTASSDGNAPTLLAYSFAGTEQVTISAGDATNPRVDLIQMKLELISSDLQSRDFQDGTTHAVTTTSMNKKKYVQCTLSVKSGTPAANPQYPDPDAGYVAVGGVVVGPTYATGTQIYFGYIQGDLIGATTPTQTKTLPLSGKALAHDQRMPLNVQAYETHPNLFEYVTAWAAYTGSGTTAGTITGATSSNATNLMNIPSTKAGATSRLVGISCQNKKITDDTAKMGLYSSSQLTIPVGLSYITGFTAGNPTWMADFFVPYYTFEGLMFSGPLCKTSDANHFTVVASATNKIGTPIWSNGQPSPFVNDASVGPLGGVRSSVYMKIDSGQSGSFIGYFNWYWADGI